MIEKKKLEDKIEYYKKLRDASVDCFTEDVAYQMEIWNYSSQKLQKLEDLYVKLYKTE